MGEYPERDIPVDDAENLLKTLQDTLRPGGKSADS